MIMDKSPENAEKKFEALAEAVSETVESIGEILSPGERFALHPTTFTEAEQYGESEVVLEALIVGYAMEQLSVDPKKSGRRIGGSTYLATNQPNTFVGTDGEAWWIEIIPAEEGSKEDVVPAEIQRNVTGDLARVGDVGLPKAERLARLREAKEVVEDDSDLNDIFMYARSDMPLSRKNFIKDFPKARALVITQEQLWKIEADGSYFSYITADGVRKYLNAEEMDEPLVLFLEDFGD